MEGIEHLKALLELKDFKSLDLITRCLDVAIKSIEDIEGQTDEQTAGYQILNKAGLLRKLPNGHRSNPFRSTYILTPLGKQVHAELTEDNFYKTQTTSTS